MFLLAFGGCGDTVQVRENKAISRGVYGTYDAMEVGRFDVAKTLTTDLTRIVPPPAPKDRIKITPFQRDAQTSKKQQPRVSNNGTIPEANYEEKFVVLPPGFNNTNVIVADSREYRELLSENEQLRRNESKLLSDLQANKDRNDKLLGDKEAELDKLRSKKSLWSKIKGLFKWTGIGIFGIGTILFLVSLAVPGVWALAWAILKAFGSIISLILRLFASGINRIFNK